MPEFIGAKCFGCGHIIKVPVALGGKKARCPKCSDVITIPTPGDSAMEIVSDDMLEEVARDGEILEEEGLQDAGPKTPIRPTPRPGSGGRTSTPRRGTSIGTPRSGTRMRYSPSGSSSSAKTFWIIGAGIGLIILLAFLLGRPGGDPPPRPKAPPVTGGATGNPRSETADDLKIRCGGYLQAFKKAGSPDELLKYFHGADSSDKAIKAGLTKHLEQRTEYQEVVFKSASVEGDEGTVTFVCDFVTKGESSKAKEMTLRWRRVNNEWYLADRP